MPFIIKNTVGPRALWGVWEVNEPLESLVEDLIMSDFDKNEYAQITHPTRMYEWVGARKALQTLALDFGIEYKGIVKEANGKSYLVDSNAHISISHTKDFAAVMIHYDTSVGIDIELLKEKIELIAHKFISDEEFGFINKNMNKLTIAWCAKEAVYKSIGVDGISFKDHIRLHDFDAILAGRLVAEVIHPDFKQSVVLNYILMKNFCVAHTVI
ncbi:MAG: 4'-phosphopantetheinyl transferase superfamily protein [Cytophagales bacterium]